MENGADNESTDSEVCRARIQFSATRKEEKGEMKRTTDYGSRMCAGERTGEK